jgi:hypothetical protein
VEIRFQSFPINFNLYRYSTVATLRNPSRDMRQADNRQDSPPPTLMMIW